MNATELTSIESLIFIIQSEKNKGLLQLSVQLVQIFSTKYDSEMVSGSR